jgi:hypothetical protein
MAFANSVDSAQFENFSNKKNTAVLHFVGPVKPWQKCCNPNFFDLWWKYASPLRIMDLVPLEIQTLDQGMSLAGSFDMNGMYREASELKGFIIQHLLNNNTGELQ